MVSNTKVAEQKRRMRQLSDAEISSMVHNADAWQELLDEHLYSYRSIGVVYLRYEERDRGFFADAAMLDLSTRARNVLYKHGYKSIRQIKEAGTRKLMQMHRFSHGTLLELIEAFGPISREGEK